MNLLSMNLLIDFNREICTFKCDELTPLSWVAFGIESCALWYLGRCQWQLSFARSRGNGSQVIFYVAPLRPGGMVRQLLFSNFTPLKNIGADFPARLTEPWQLGGTMIQIHGVREEATLGFMGYWLADCVVDLFLRGAVNAQVQFSRERVQLDGNVSLDEKRLAELASPDVVNYNPGDCVRDLKWPESMGAKPATGKTAL